MHRTVRVFTLGLGLVSGLAAVAMPTKAQFQKVMPLVREVSADDNAAVKAGRLSPAKAGDNALARAKETSLDEASRYLFCEAAFAHYVKAAEYDKAAGVIEQLKKCVADVPDSAIVELIERRLRKVPRKHAGQLYEMLREARLRESLKGKLAAYRKALAANPKDDIHHLRVAAATLLLDGWKEGLKAFADCKGQIAKAAQSERDGKPMKALQIADFWWSYKLLDTAFNDSSDLLEEKFKAHAAEWYRLALSRSELDGVRKQVVEKRIADYPDAKMTTASMAALRKIVADLGEGVKMEFLECPAGTFTMGVPGDKDKTSPWYAHKVTITRSFYMSKYPVTTRQYLRLVENKRVQEKDAIIPNQPAFVSYGEIKNYIQKLSEKMAVPRGLVLRLPTEAEYEYALRANVDNPEDPYHPDNDMNEKLLAQRLWLAPEIGQLMASKGVGLKKYGDPNQKFPCFFGPPQVWGGIYFEKPGHNGSWIMGPVGERLSNVWGFCDFIASATLDSVGDQPQPEQELKSGQPLLTYADEETDPLRVGQNYIKRSAPRHKLIRRLKGLDCGPFRLVIGPDLMKEKGFAK